MSQAHATAATHTSARTGRPLQTLHEALQLFWTVADEFAQRRLLVALALVACGALLAAGTPVALNLVIDSLAQGVGQSGDVVLAGREELPISVVQG